MKRGSTKDNSVPDSEHTHDKPVGWYYFFLAGYLNTNSNTGHVKSVNTFFNELNVIKAWSKYDIDFTYERNEITHVSVIDHFYWCVTDHEPIYSVINIQKIETSKNDVVNNKVGPSYKKMRPKMIVLGLKIISVINLITLRYRSAAKTVQMFIVT